MRNVAVSGFFCSLLLFPTMLTSCKTANKSALSANKPDQAGEGAVTAAEAKLSEEAAQAAESIMKKLSAAGVSEAFYTTVPDDFRDPGQRRALVSAEPVIKFNKDLSDEKGAAALARLRAVTRAMKLRKIWINLARNDGFTIYYFHRNGEETSIDMHLDAIAKRSRSWLDKNIHGSVILDRLTRTIQSLYESVGSVNGGQVSTNLTDLIVDADDATFDRFIQLLPQVEKQRQKLGPILKNYDVIVGLDPKVNTNLVEHYTTNGTTYRHAYRISIVKNNLQYLEQFVQGKLDFGPPIIKKAD